MLNILKEIFKNFCTAKAPVPLSCDDSVLFWELKKAQCVIQARFLTVDVTGLFETKPNPHAHDLYNAISEFVDYVQATHIPDTPALNMLPEHIYNYQVVDLVSLLEKIKNKDFHIDDNNIFRRKETLNQCIRLFNNNASGYSKFSSEMLNTGA